MARTLRTSLLGGLVCLTAVFAPYAQAQVSLNYAQIKLIDGPSLGLTGLTGLAADAQGNLYISDSHTDNPFSDAGLFKLSPNQPGLPSIPVQEFGQYIYPTLPDGVAVDLAGDLFVAGDVNGTLEFPAGCNNDNCNIAIAADTFSGAVAVNSSGALLVASDTQHGLLSFPKGCTDISCSTTILNDGRTITGIATDSSGNIFVVEAGYGVIKLAGGCSSNCESKIAGGTVTPYGIAADPAGSGNIVVSDQGTGNLVYVPAGCNESSCQTILGSSFSKPGAVAWDTTHGNFYVTDGNNAVWEVQKYSVVFGAISVGSSSTATLSFNAATAPGYVTAVTQGINLDFSVTGAPTCNSTVCSVSVQFSPTAPGLRLGAVELFDSSKNLLATTQLSGAGVAPAVAFNPGTQTPIGYGISQPTQAAADAQGNFYLGGEYQGVNAVVKIPPGCTAASCQTTIASQLQIGSGLVQSAGLAVDGAGDVIIGNGDGRNLISVPPGCTSSSCQTAITFLTDSTISAAGIGLDSFGDIFVADSANSKVLELLTASPSLFQLPVFAGGLSGAQNVALDPYGDVFVADTGNNRVLETNAFCATSTCASQVGFGLNQPTQVALDAAGDLFIADSGNGRVVELPVGCTDSSCQITLASGLASPQGLAVSSSGNLLVSLLTGTTQTEIVRSNGPALSFPNQPEGERSAAQTFTVQNIGNAALTFSGISASSIFAVDSGTTTCSTSSALASGASCTVGVVCAPTSPGTVSGTVTLTDNALNNSGSTQTAALSCSAGTPPAITSPNQSAFYGSSSFTITTTGYPAPTISETGPLPANMSFHDLGNGTAYITDNNAAVGTLASITIQATNGIGSPATQTFSIYVNPVPATGASFTGTNTNFGNVPLGSTATLSVPFQLSGALNIHSVVETQDSTDFKQTSTTCSGIQASTCSVTVSFLPSAAGPRSSLVELLDAGGDLLASVEIHGVGVGPAVAFLPGAQSTVASGLLVNDVAVDGQGNLFVSQYSYNNVINIPAGCQNGAQCNTLNISLNHPGPLAVDGAGNLFVLDGDGRLLELPFGCTSNACEITLAAGFATQTNPPTGLALDQVGDIFVSDTSNNRVVEIPAGCSDPSCWKTVGSGLTAPFGVAVDLAGNVFIVNNYYSVIEVPSGCTSASCQVSVAQNLPGSPVALAVDAAGNLFIGEFPSPLVVEVPKGCTSSSCWIEMVNGQTSGTGVVALDAFGDVFTGSDTSLFEVQRAKPPTLTFSTTAIGANSTSQTVTLQNIGNGPLTFSSFVADPNFALDSSKTTCSTSSALAPGASCNVAAYCSPQAPGSLSGFLTINDKYQSQSAVDVFAQTVPLACSATGIAPSITSASGTGFTEGTPGMFTVSATGTPTPIITETGALPNGLTLVDNHNGTATLSGTATATGISIITIEAANGVLPNASQQFVLAVTATQTINFAAISPQSAAVSLSLSATATSGLPVSFSSSTQMVCTVSGNIVKFLSGGTCTIVASQMGDISYQPAPQVTQSFTVVENAGPPSVVSINPVSGSGATQSFSAVVSDPNGAADLGAVYVLFNESVAASNGCYVLYYPPTNQLYLKNDAGTANSSPLVPGVAGTVSNSQCSVSGTGTSYNTSGNTATLTVAITFAGSAPTNSYVYAAERNDVNSGFVRTGTWGALTATPAVLSVTPSSGSVNPQVYSVAVSDQDGASNLNGIYLLFNRSVTAANGCYIVYQPVNNQFYLKSDDGTTTNSASLTPGGSGTISNSLCSVAAAGSLYTASGNTATLSLAITFNQTTPTNIYAYASDKDGKNSGFVKQGTYGVSVGPPGAVSVTPASGAGASQIFTATYSDPNGALDLTTLSVLFNTQIAAPHSCYVTYNPITNQLFLTNDADTAQSAGITPGTTATVSNSQCTLAASGSSYTTSGDTATLNLALTFTGTAPANIYLYAQNLLGSNTGFVKKGLWGESAGLPQAVSVTPSSGSGTTQSFTATFSDPNGAADLQTYSLLFNTQVAAAQSCYVTYNPHLNLLYLTNDTDTGQSAGLTLGSAGSVSNSQCMISGTGSAFSTAGTTATLTVAVAFLGTTPLNVYLYAQEIDSSSTGFVKEGTWTP